MTENKGANKGRLYLIPSPLGDNDPAEVIPGPVLESLKGFRSFIRNIFSSKRKRQEARLAEEQAMIEEGRRTIEIEKETDNDGK